MPSIDSILNDYLDDRLDADTRRRLEAALDVDERLRRALQSLIEVRELVAVLPRESQVDVAPQVLSRISRTGRAARLQAIAGRISLESRVAVASALAASILIFLGSVAVQRYFRIDGGPLFVANRLMTAIGARPPGPARPNPDRDPVPETTPAAPTLGIVALRDDETAGDLSLTGRFLDHPQLDLRLIIDGNSEVAARVAQVISQSTRYNFLQLKLAEGLVIDPKCPAPAEMYAVALPRQDVVMLRKRLQAAVGPTTVRETRFDPELATMLVETVSPHAFRPHPRADVFIPAGNLALRLENPLPRGADPLPPPSDAEPSEPTPEQYRSAPITDPDLAHALKSHKGTAPEQSRPPLMPGPGTNPPGQARGSQPGDTDRIIVIVWVSRTNG